VYRYNAPGGHDGLDLEDEDLASGGQDHFFHIFAVNAETPSTYAGDDLMGKGVRCSFQSVIFCN
jgi:hypothetical protein